MQEMSICLSARHIYVYNYVYLCLALLFTIYIYVNGFLLPQYVQQSTFILLIDLYTKQRL